MNKKDISKEFLIKRFEDLKSELGRTPNRDEMGYRVHIKKYWNGYNDFLRSQETIPNFKRTKEDYINEIKRIYKEIGKVPSQEYLKDNKILRPEAISFQFGSYNKLLEVAGLDTRDVTRNDKTKEELLDEYIQMCNEYGRWVKGKELLSVAIYENRFGSLIKLRELAVKSGKLKIKDKRINKPYEKYTDDEIEDYIIGALRTFGKDIKVSEFKRYLKSVKGCTITTIEKRTKTTSVKELAEKYGKYIDNI